MSQMPVWGVGAGGGGVVAAVVIVGMVMVTPGGSFVESTVQASGGDLRSNSILGLCMARGMENGRWVECSWMIDLGSFGKIASVKEYIKNPGPQPDFSEGVPI